MNNDFFNKSSSQRQSFNTNSNSGMFGSDYGVTQRSDSELVTFVKDTYKLFASTMLAGTAGAYVGVGMAGTIASAIWLFFILEIGLLFGIHFVKHKAPLNLIVLFAFAFVSGLTLGPLLAKTLGMAGGSSIIANAFAMTTIIFGGLSLFAINTKSDFTSMGKPLFIALIVVIVGSVINMFLGNPILHIAIQGAVVMLFSFFIIYDTQNIIQGNYETPIDGAVALYLDFLNLFTALLQIFGILGDDD
jgi:modulator of FtsH protease